MQLNAAEYFSLMGLVTSCPLGKRVIDKLLIGSSRSLESYRLGLCFCMIFQAWLFPGTFLTTVGKT